MPADAKPQPKKKRKPPPPDPKKYLLIRATNGVSILVRRGDGVPTLVSGGSKFELIDRPRRRSSVQWIGDEPYRMDVPILFDGWQGNKDVERDIARVQLMRHSRGELSPPVRVYVDGALPVKGGLWYIEDITWGDQVIWNTRGKGMKGGFRLRQNATLHLLQVVPISVLKLLRPPSATTTYRVKVGDTAASIAAKFGISVTALRKANNIRDAKKIAGMVHKTIQIPPSTIRLG